MKKNFRLLFSAFFLLAAAGTVGAQGSLEERLKVLEKKMEKSEAAPTHTHDDKHITHQEGAGTAVGIGGVSIGFGGTMVFQGTSGNDTTVEESTDGTYSTDIELTAAVGKGTAFALVEAGDGAGVADIGVNGDVRDRNNMFDITELWYEHSVLGGMLTYTMGLLDMSNYFDGNSVANDETYQFLADPFINSMVIDFGEGPGFRLTASPNDLLDISLGWQEKGDDGAPWDNLFGESFYMGEVDLKPEYMGLQGNYRLYYWSDGSAHARFGDATCMTCEHETGFGLSLDQQILDSLTVFARYAVRDEDVEQWESAWSAGLGLTGAFWGRDSDSVGVAYGMMQLSGKFKTYGGTTAKVTSDENHFEIFYNLAVNENFAVTGDIQNVSSPGGVDSADSVLVYGLRTQISF